MHVPQVPVLKSRVSTRQFRLSKDAADDGTYHDLQQWLKRKQSVWQNDNANPFLDKVKYFLCRNSILE